MYVLFYAVSMVSLILLICLTSVKVRCDKNGCDSEVAPSYNWDSISASGWDVSPSGIRATGSVVSHVTFKFEIESKNFHLDFTGWARGRGQWQYEIITSADAFATVSGTLALQAGSWVNTDKSITVQKGSKVTATLTLRSTEAGSELHYVSMRNREPGSVEGDGDVSERCASHMGVAESRWGTVLVPTCAGMVPVGSMICLRSPITGGMQWRGDSSCMLVANITALSDTSARLEWASVPEGGCSTLSVWRMREGVEVALPLPALSCTSTSVDVADLVQGDSLRLVEDTGSALSFSSSAFAFDNGE
jgi:hypothetical protein